MTWRDTIHRWTAPKVREKGVVELPNLSALYADQASFFQRDISRSPQDAMASPAVYACVSTIAEDVAKLPFRHWALNGDTRTPLRQSNPSRVMRRPNSYQTCPQFLLSQMVSLLLRGNAYAYLVYNGRNEVVEMHHLESASPYVAPDGSIFYNLTESDVANNPRGLVPSRYILHLRGITYGHPLRGITPIMAAALSANAGLEIGEKVRAFAQKMVRPGGVAFIDGTTLTVDQAKTLRKQFDEQFGRDGVGGVLPVPTKGSFEQLTMSAVDADVVNLMKWTAEDVARVFKVPAYRIGIGALPAVSAEVINRTYLSGTLSFYLTLIEQSLERVFEVPSTEHIEADLDELLRADFLQRMEGLSKAVQGGILSPNDARAREGEAPKDGGDALFLQRQMTPVSLLTELAAGEIAKAKEPAPEPQQQPMDKNDLAKAVAMYLESA